MVDLRPGWWRRRLGQLVQRHVERVATVENFAKFVGVEHLDSETLRLRRCGELGVDTLPPTFKFVFRAGMVLVPTRRPRLRKCAVPKFDGLTGEKLLVLKPLPNVPVLPEFLPFLLSSPRVQDWNIEKEVGSVTPHFRWTDMAECEVLLPPPVEQRRCVEALLRADDSVDACRELLVRAGTVHSSAVDALVTGAFASGGSTELNSLIEEGRPITYGILKPGVGFPGGVPVIKVRDFPDGEIMPTDLLLTDPKIDLEYRRSRLRAGDLLMSIRGTIGRLAFVPPLLEAANITQDTARLSVRRDVSREFVRAVLESSPLKLQIRSHTTGLAVQGINIGELRRLRVPMITKAQQDRIADAIEITRVARQAAADRLRDSVALRSAILRAALGEAAP